MTTRVHRQLHATGVVRLHDTTGDDLGLLQDPAPNVEPGDVVVLADDGEAIVMARFESQLGYPIQALLEVVMRTRVKPKRRPSGSLSSLGRDGRSMADHWRMDRAGRGARDDQPRHRGLRADHR